MLYFFPECTGGEDLKEFVDLDDVDVAEESCCHRSPGSGCVEEFTHLVSPIIMQKQNLSIATTAEEAVILYSTLLESIEDLV